MFKTPNLSTGSKKFGPKPVSDRKICHRLKEGGKNACVVQSITYISPTDKIKRLPEMCLPESM